MKKFLLPLVLAGLLAGTFSCSKADIAAGTPQCIKNKINDGRNDPHWLVGSVDEYLYQGNIVYAFAPDGRIVADGATDIWSSSCQYICSVGGFVGPVQLCNGEQFFPNATFRRNIWTKK
jgi:hypothetical protein